MNCCNEYGQCNGGKGCPVGEPLPIDMLDDPADEGAPSWLDLITVIVLVAMLIGLGFYVGRVTA